MGRAIIAALGVFVWGITGCGFVSDGDTDLFERVEVQALEGCEEPVDLTSVLPAIEQSCGVCHVTQALGGLQFGDENGLLTVESFRATTVSQPSLQTDKFLLEPGNENESYLIDRVLQRESSPMPPGGPPLDDAAAEALRCWVEQGAQGEPSP